MRPVQALFMDEGTVLERARPEDFDAGRLLRRSMGQGARGRSIGPGTHLRCQPRP